MNFFVTYCLIDHEVAGNQFWHSCLLLSYWPGQDQKIEVKKAYGFYSGPMAAPDSIIGKIKKKLNFPFDFFGNYGQLKEEEMRYLDIGYGLRGQTIEISFEQYAKLQKICAERMRVEDKTIREIKAAFEKSGTEPTSSEIFAEEKRRAIIDNRPPRLDPFEIYLSLDLQGLTLNKSHTCKSMALKLLHEIGIEEEYLARITNDNRPTLMLTFFGALSLQPFGLRPVTCPVYA